MADTVKVGIYAENGANCGGVGGVGGPLDVDDTYFLVTNPVTREGAREGTGGVNNCVHFETEVGYDSIHIWTWSQWTELAYCDQLVPDGRFLELEISIDANTPPGDYPLSWGDGGYLAGEGGVDCNLEQPELTVIDGFIRVL